MTNDLLAYLIVLNHQPTLDCLAPAEIRRGRKHIIGCLVRLEEAMRQEPHRFAYVYGEISVREHLNGLHPVGHPALAEATERCAKAVYCVLEGRPRKERKS